MSDMGPVWLGMFQDSHIAENSMAYFLCAGYPRDAAEKMGASLNTFIFAQDGENFLMTVVSPAAKRVNILCFNLGQKTEITRKHGTSITSLFEWHDEERKLSAFFCPEDGDPFEMHFSFNETYQTIHRYRKAGPVESRTIMHRLA
ncbi:hypothetical protein RvY_04033-1 [Ramazzottius varieornatus]|uniref:Uncharacterized protein n=1 Tax=Ramazzottius varieornatus TaxID=947166 RepID=A0A1D1UTQ3_RAMVA|nr:hypothetical protein RvY_04033-1 [Ramazzottius varieornatus]